MEPFIAILKQYGPWVMLLAVCVFVIVKGELTFRYPRKK